MSGVGSRGYCRFINMLIAMSTNIVEGAFSWRAMSTIIVDTFFPLDLLIFLYLRFEIKN